MAKIFSICKYILIANIYTYYHLNISVPIILNFTSRIDFKLIYITWTAISHRLDPMFANRICESCVVFFHKIFAANTDNDKWNQMRGLTFFSLPRVYLINHLHWGRNHIGCNSQGHNHNIECCIYAWKNVRLQMTYLFYKMCRNKEVNELYTCSRHKVRVNEKLYRIHMIY